VFATLCGLNRLQFGRLADDTVISGGKKAAGDALVRQIETEFKERGLRINAKKRQEMGFQSNSNQQHVHSIVVNSRHGTRISDEHRKLGRELAESYVAACKAVQSSSLEAVAYKRRRLAGMMYYQRQAKFSMAKHLYQMLRCGDRIIAQKLKDLRISPNKGNWWFVGTGRNEPRSIAGIMHLREMGIYPMKLPSGGRTKANYKRIPKVVSAGSQRRRAVRRPNGSQHQPNSSGST
jgi:hypothetical protein